MSGGANIEPTVYHVGLAKGPGGVVGVVFGLPGCRCVARSETEIREIVPVAIAEHLAWLDGHGKVTRDAFPILYEVVEEVDVSSVSGVAYGEFCFEDDLRPIQREEVKDAMQVMGYSREDLIALVRPLPDMVLDWQPPADAVQADPWAPEPRTIRDVLSHIAATEGHYARNLGPVLEPPQDEPARTELFGQRERVLERLRALDEETLRAEFRHRPSAQEAGYEHWTVRKALRRFISHERFHTKEIEQRLAWLLLGTPQVKVASKAGA
jgi:hypothetical protein